MPNLLKWRFPSGCQSYRIQVRSGLFNEYPARNLQFTSHFPAYYRFFFLTALILLTSHDISNKTHTETEQNFQFRSCIHILFEDDLVIYLPQTSHSLTTYLEVREREHTLWTILSMTRRCSVSCQCVFLVYIGKKGNIFSRNILRSIRNAIKMLLLFLYYVYYYKLLQTRRFLLDYLFIYCYDYLIFIKFFFLKREEINE